MRKNIYKTLREKREKIIVIFTYSLKSIFQILPTDSLIWIIRGFYPCIKEFFILNKLCLLCALDFYFTFYILLILLTYFCKFKEIYFRFLLPIVLLWSFVIVLTYFSYENGIGVSFDLVIGLDE